MDRRLVGYCDVDSGTIWIGDPCYVVAKDSSHVFESWSDYCDKSSEMFEVGHSEPAGAGMGITLPTLDGDGAFPVYVEYEENMFGAIRPARITIDFNPPYDSDEEDN